MINVTIQIRDSRHRLRNLPTFPGVSTIDFKYTQMNNRSFGLSRPRQVHAVVLSVFPIRGAYMILLPVGKHTIE